VQVIAGGQNVVQGAAPLRHQLPHDSGDAADAATPRVHVRGQRHVARPGDALVCGRHIRPVADRVVDHHHTGPGALTLGKVQQRIDRSDGGVDLNRRHTVI
jgi:hypothetical protein